VQTVRLPYKVWAENRIACIKGTLNGARAEHMQAVKDCIDEVLGFLNVLILLTVMF
jgi:hypothetical protein